MGLGPATRKTATEEDRGEDNKDPDWLIEQSIVRQVAGGVLHCATLKKVDKIFATIVAKSRIKFYFLQRLRQQTNCDRDELLSLYVTLGQFWYNLRRNKIARQIARKLPSITVP